MGVYIPNLEIPTSCFDCPVSHPALGNLGAAILGCPLIGKTLSAPFCEEKRMDNCPLVPVPPHGRLIDADALADVFRGFIAMYDSCPFSQLAQTDKARRDELQAALAEVINAPTILEAEEGE